MSPYTRFLLNGDYLLLLNMKLLLVTIKYIKIILVKMDYVKRNIIL